MNGIYAVKFPSGIEGGCDHCVAHTRTNLAGYGVGVFGCLVDRFLNVLEVSTSLTFCRCCLYRVDFWFVRRRRKETRNRTERPAFLLILKNARNL
jgi:hypothetical protein